MYIGFNNGIFYRLYKQSNDRFTADYINTFQANGKTNNLELHCINQEEIDYLIDTDNIDLSNFSHLSLHAPNHHYADDELSHTILTKISKACKKYPIKNIVFHPDKVQDRTVFNTYKDLPLSIENMDNLKKSYKSLEDIESILTKYDFFWFTLDLQHCFTNDPSEKLAKDFQDKCKDRIVEYHISGYAQPYLHHPLYQTEQKNIIQSLQYPNIPIIIESTMDNVDELEKEIDYITKHIT
jgi:endonuclease IV